MHQPRTAAVAPRSDTRRRNHVDGMTSGRVLLHHIRAILAGQIDNRIRLVLVDESVQRVGIGDVQSFVQQIGLAARVDGLYVGRLFETKMLADYSARADDE